MEEQKNTKQKEASTALLLPHEEAIIRLFAAIGEQGFITDLYSSLNNAVLAAHRHQKTAGVQIDIKISPCTSPEGRFDIKGKIKNKFPIEEHGSALFFSSEGWSKDNPQQAQFDL